MASSWGFSGLHLVALAYFQKFWFVGDLFAYLSWKSGGKMQFADGQG